MKTRYAPQNKLSTNPDQSTPIGHITPWEVSGMELCFLADVLHKTHFCPTSPAIIQDYELANLTALLSQDDQFYDCAEKWGISDAKIILKLRSMPSAIKAEILNHIVEASKCSDHECISFLTSRRFPISPFLQQDEGRTYLLAAKFATGELVVNSPDLQLSRPESIVIVHALHAISSAGRSLISEKINFASSVGLASCVATTDSDEIIYARRKGRTGLSRFVVNRSPDPCRCVFINLKQVSRDRYALISAFLGVELEPEPFEFSRYARPSECAEGLEMSRTFWADHALVWSESLVVPDTQTRDAAKYFNSISDHRLTEAQ